MSRGASSLHHKSKSNVIKRKVADKYILIIAYYNEKYIAYFNLLHILQREIYFIL